jgi:acyl-CoA synthetase (NDP forming)
VGRSLHLVLEAPTFYQGFWWCATPLEEEPEGRHLDTVKNMVRALSKAGAVFDSLHFGLSKTTILAEVLCQYNPTGLRAMLEEGIELYKALGTGHTAFMYAANWLKAGEKTYKTRAIEKSYTVDSGRLRSFCVEKFMETRK